MRNPVAGLSSHLAHGGIPTITQRQPTLPLCPCSEGRSAQVCHHRNARQGSQMNGFMQRKGSVSRVTAFVLVILLAAVIHGSDALAATCTATQASSNPEAVRLQRQIAANRTFQVKYSCDGSATFACREIASRIAGASARLAALSPRPACDKPAVAGRGTSRRAVTRKPAAVTLPSEAKIETRCVRLSDGYHFPTPNSGYNTARDMQAIASQCRLICDDPAMDVYRITGADRNTDEMISVTSGARYADLASAGAYRTAASLKTCDMNRFYKMVMAKVPGGAMVEQAAVRPAAGPIETADRSAVLLADVGLRGTTSFVPPAARKVRVVGAAFLPEE